MTIELHHGDALEVLRELPDASCDSMVTDSPAGIGFMNLAFDADKGGRTEWIAWLAEIMREALRVLKPGAHALVWSFDRTQHWTMMALEDSGWELRQTIYHLHGQGWPKSSESLKPAIEPWILCRKALDGTVEHNISTHGCGGLNIDGCRIETDDKWEPSTRGPSDSIGTFKTRERTTEQHPKGRWPSNAIFSHATCCTDDKCGECCPVAELDRQSGELTSGKMAAGTMRKTSGGYSGHMPHRIAHDTIGDTGGASRFFYVAKPSQAERSIGLDGHNTHPTVKSIELMRWLVRLVTPPGGTVLDPFLGSGSTGIAADREGFSFIGIEQEAEYIEIARARIEGDCPLFTKVTLK